jgi:hypothetical protein
MKPHFSIVTPVVEPDVARERGKLGGYYERHGTLSRSWGSEVGLQPAMADIVKETIVEPSFRIRPIHARRINILGDSRGVSDASRAMLAALERAGLTTKSVWTKSGDLSRAYQVTTGALARFRGRLRPSPGDVIGARRWLTSYIRRRGIRIRRTTLG